MAAPEHEPFQIDSRLLRILAVAGLFGMWDAGSKRDREVVQQLTGQRIHDELEEIWTELLNLAETPVWMDGGPTGRELPSRHVATLHGSTRHTAGDRTILRRRRHRTRTGICVDKPPHRFLLSERIPSTSRLSSVVRVASRSDTRPHSSRQIRGHTIDPRLVGAPVSLRVKATVSKALQGLTRGSPAGPARSAAAPRRSRSRGVPGGYGGRLASSATPRNGHC